MVGRDEASLSYLNVWTTYTLRGREVNHANFLVSREVNRQRGGEGALEIELETEREGDREAMTRAPAAPARTPATATTNEDTEHVS